MGTAKGITPKNQRLLCAWCGEEFWASREDAGTCSSRCRTAFSRHKTGAKPRRAPTKADLQEQLRLARLEATLWERAFHAAAEEWNKGKRT